VALLLNTTRTPTRAELIGTAFGAAVLSQIARPFAIPVFWSGAVARTVPLDSSMNLTSARLGSTSGTAIGSDPPAR
jgi:hypothetical protein